MKGWADDAVASGTGHRQVGPFLTGSSVSYFDIGLSTSPRPLLQRPQVPDRRVSEPIK
jgi:hypothetical protein